VEYYGKPYVQKEDYDLMEVVILNLGDARTESEYKILDLLNTLFSQEITPDEKKEILNQKFNIATTAELESEVQGMCNLGSAIENKGKEIGRAEGREEQAKATAIRMSKKGLPVEMIADAIGFSIDEVKAWIG
jgi:predicted transposase/invertase (TIGR01784 family)